MVRGIVRWVLSNLIMKATLSKPVPRVCLKDCKWDNFASYKRRCTSCGKEQWVMENKYPDIGEPQYEWKDMY